MPWRVAGGMDDPQAAGDINHLAIGENFSHRKMRIVPIWQPSEDAP